MTRRRPIRHSLAALAVFWPLLAGGCIFDPRDPEAPSGTVCFEEVVAGEGRQVFTNLDGALRCEDTAIYLNQLTEDFEFIASPEAESQYPGIFDAWGKEREQQFLDALFADASAIDANLDQQILEETGTAEILFETRYRVAVTGAGGGQIEYIGEAFFTARQSEGVWKLSRWEEKASSNPLGLLRGALSQGG